MFCPRVNIEFLLFPGNPGTKEFSDADLGIVTMHACNPEFAIEALRLESFNAKWPSSLTQTPDVLSSAGFFYVGETSRLKQGSNNYWNADVL